MYYFVIISEWWELTSKNHSIPEKFWVRECGWFQQYSIFGSNTTVAPMKSNLLWLCAQNQYEMKTDKMPAWIWKRVKCPILSWAVSGKWWLLGESEINFRMKTLRIYPYTRRWPEHTYWKCWVGSLGVEQGRTHEFETD